jgi:hypothetical protein
MVQTTRLQLPLIAAAQAQKHVTHNEAVMRLDALVQMNAKSYTVSAQPGSPADGDLYLLPAGKTGTDWGGAANHAVAHYYDGIWHFYAPVAGWLSFIGDTARLVTYNGTSWGDLVSPGAAAAADGTASAPGFAFASDTNTGLYRIGADQLGIATGGTLRKTISTTAETGTLPRLGPDGSAAAPAVSFSADTDNGLYRIGTNNPGMAAGGSLVESWATAGITRPLQPAFQVYNHAGQTNLTDAGYTTITFDTETFDRGGNFASNTFTAPVTGLYQFSVILRLGDLGTTARASLQLFTTAQIYTLVELSPAAVASSAGLVNLCASILANMTAGDTAYLRIYLSGAGSNRVDIAADSTFFAGFLVA